MCQPCSRVAETIAPKADRISNRAALLFVSRFCSTTRFSLLAVAKPTLHRGGAFFPALSSRQLAAQVQNLPYMMIRMARTAKENLEAIGGFGFELGGVSFSPVVGVLLLYCSHHHGDGAVECRQRFFLGRRLRIGELTVAVAQVARFRDTGSDVIVQIACEV